jgi:hypothetical protein
MNGPLRSTNFWPPQSSEERRHLAGGNRDLFVSRLLHDAGHSISLIGSVAAFLAEGESGLSPDARPTVARLTEAVTRLRRDFGLMRQLVTDQHSISCDFVEHILQPALLLAQRLQQRSHFRLTAAATARGAPRVRVLMPAAFQAVAHMLLSVGPSRIRCIAEAHDDYVLFHLAFQAETRAINVEERHLVASLLRGAGVIPGEAPSGGTPHSLTLRLERAT